MKSIKNNFGSEKKRGEKKKKGMTYAPIKLENFFNNVLYPCSLISHASKQNFFAVELGLSKFIEVCFQ